MEYFKANCGNCRKETIFLNTGKKMAKLHKIIYKTKKLIDSEYYLVKCEGCGWSWWSS